MTSKEIKEVVEGMTKEINGIDDPGLVSDMLQTVAMFEVAYQLSQLVERPATPTDEMLW
jgi:hypothetical protein